MFKFDHFVVNINGEYQKNKKIINEIITAGYPYEPSWGKGTRGFKASNIWIGNQYLEMISILKEDGGGWKEEWVQHYNKGNRGLICIMLDVSDINQVCTLLKNRNIEVTNPENLSFKWFFNLFTRTMPWKNCYTNFFKGVPLQIGFQQMDDDKSRDFMKQYMVPNSKENNIAGIKKILVRGPFTKEDKVLIKGIFKDFLDEEQSLIIKLSENEVLVFEENSEYSIEMFSDCSNEELKNKSIVIENIKLNNNCTI